MATSVRSGTPARASTSRTPSTGPDRHVGRFVGRYVGRVGDDESHLVAALRAGDETAFAGLVSNWSRPMLLLARGFVSTDASAEEVVQDTWLAVIRGLDGFEGRAALR